MPGATARNSSLPALNSRIARQVGGDGAGPWDWASGPRGPSRPDPAPLANLGHHMSGVAISRSKVHLGRRAIASTQILISQPGLNRRGGFATFSPPAITADAMLWPVPFGQGDGVRSCWSGLRINAEAQLWALDRSSNLPLPLSCQLQRSERCIRPVFDLFEQGV